MNAASPATDSWEELCSEALKPVSTVKLPDNFQVPALPTALNKFVDAAEDPDVEIKLLGKIIEQDPGLTIDLLKCVNVAAFGGRRPAGTPSEALVRLGIPKAKNYLISMGIKSATLRFQSRLMNHQNFWNESLQRALFAQSLSRHIKTESDLAFMGGLLQDFMLPVLTNMYDSVYLDYLNSDGTKNLCQWEEEHFGWTHAAVAAAVAREWNMTEELICCIYYHHRLELPLSDPAGKIFNIFPATLGALLPDQLKQVPDGMKRLVTASERSKHFDLLTMASEVDEGLDASCDSAHRPNLLTPVVERALKKYSTEQQPERLTTRNRR